MPASAPHNPTLTATPGASRPSLGDRMRALRIRAKQPGRVKISGRTRVGHGVRVDVSPGARLLVGDRVELGDGCRLEVHAGTVEIGDRVVVGEGCRIVARAGILIGPDCMLGDGVVIIDFGQRFDDPEVPIRLQDLVKAPIQIDPGALLGQRAVVLSGVRVGTGARVGAQAVVDHDVPAGALVEGVPARPPIPPGGPQARRTARRGRRGPRPPRR